MSAVGVIPARYGSTRFPGKALVDIDGRPMIEHVYRRVAASRSIAGVTVATDDERIMRAVERFGGTVVMTGSHPSGTDRAAEVAERLTCELIVNVQGDEPLIEPQMIDEALAPLRSDPHVVMTTLSRRIEDPAELADPNVTKVVVDQEGFALYFSRAAIPFRRSSERSAPPYKHIGLYAYRREFLLRLCRLEPTPLERAEALEQLRALEHGFRIRVIETKYDSIGVDTPADLERVRALMASGVSRNVSAKTQR